MLVNNYLAKKLNWQNFGLLAGLLGPTAAAAVAQQVPRPATHIDSLRAARNQKLTYYLAQFTFANGREVRGYVDYYSTCLFDRVNCYEVPPDRLPAPPVKAISIERLYRMTVDGHTLEALELNGRPMKMLAENMATPGLLQIFGYAKTKNDMLIPIPLPVGGALFVSTGTHDKYYWYVRAEGGELKEVPRGQRAFVEFMSELCQKSPAIVADLKTAQTAKEPRYRIDNAPELVSRYNTAMSGRE